MCGLCEKAFLYGRAQPGNDGTVGGIGAGNAADADGTGVVCQCYAAGTERICGLLAVAGLDFTENDPNIKNNCWMEYGLYPKKWTVKKSTSCCRIETTTGGAVMSRQYTKMEIISEEVFRRKAAGESNRQIAESYGLTKYQIKQLVARQNRKARLIANGYVPRPKGRPRKNSADEETKRYNELVQLRMQVELLRNFLSEVGRR